MVSRALPLRRVAPNRLATSGAPGSALSRRFSLSTLPKFSNELAAASALCKSPPYSRRARSRLDLTKDLIVLDFPVPAEPRSISRIGAVKECRESMTISWANFCQGSRSLRSTTSAPSPTNALPYHLSRNSSRRFNSLQGTLHASSTHGYSFGLNNTPKPLCLPSTRAPPPTERSGACAAAPAALKRSSTDR